MGPFNRKAAEVVEEVVAIEAEAMSTAVMAVLGFIAFLYGATVIVFLYQESKVGQRHRPRCSRRHRAAAPPRFRRARCRRTGASAPPPLLPPPPPPPQIPPPQC